MLGARNLTLAEVIQGKDDGRLPMDDFNTQGGGVRRASGPDGGRAPVQQRFNNVQYFEGTVSALAQGPAR